MRVFVHLEEEDFREDLDMGEVADNMPLRELRELCLGRVVHRIPASRREISRHFWYNDILIPFRDTRTVVGDITAASAAVLYLRPDLYRIRLPKHPLGTYAVDLEIPIREVIDRCLEREGAAECFELLSSRGKVLDPDRTLLDYRILPYSRATDGQETVLIIRKKRTITRAMIAVTVVLCLVGFLLGYLL